MKKIVLSCYIISFITLFAAPYYCWSQSIAINNDGSSANASAMLDIKSINKGLLIPRMNTVQRLAIANPAEGLTVFDLDTKTFWFYNGTGWIQSATGAPANFWGLNGNNIFNTNSGNIGIGTNNPSSLLTLQTPLNTSGYRHIGGNNEIIVTEAIGSVSASLGTTTNHPFRIMSNSIGRLHVYTGGEVIVGSNTTGSFGKFTVETSNNSYGISHTSVEGNILSTRIGGTTAGIGTFTHTHMRLFCNGTSAMLIDAANGNIGIGTDAPLARLHVAGNLLNDGGAEFTGNIGIGTPATFGVRLHINQDVEALRLSGNQPYMTFFNGATFKGYMRNIGADNIEIGTAPANTNGKLNLSIKGTPYLVIQNNGQVSVNGIPAPSFSPSFTVNGNFAINGGGSEWTIEPAECFDPGGPCLFFHGNGFIRGKIDAAGDWISMSDRSLKENIQAHTPVLDKLCRIQVATYRLKANATGINSFGLIAQNVNEYFPEIVSQAMDTNGKKLLGIAYAKTGVLAIKAIQEQQEIINQQQQRIQNLEEQMAILIKLLDGKIK